MFDSDSWQTSPQSRYNQAKLSIHDRGLKVAAVVESLEREMELLCLTGVEDQLQADVRPTLELLRNAGIKVRKKCLENDDILSKSLRWSWTLIWFSLDLDVDGRQTGDGDVHRQKLPFGLQEPGHPRLQTGTLSSALTHPHAATIPRG